MFQAIARCAKCYCFIGYIDPLGDVRFAPLLEAQLLVTEAPKSITLCAKWRLVYIKGLILLMYDVFLFWFFICYLRYLFSCMGVVFFEFISFCIFPTFH